MPTKTELLKNRLNIIFSNRESYIDTFDELLSVDKLPFSIYHISGMPGIGKTMLLVAFEERCKQKNIPVAYIDVSTQRSISEILRSIRDQLSESEDIRFEEFDNSVKSYVEIYRKLRKVEDLPIRAVEFLSKASILSPRYFNPKDSESVQNISEAEYGLVINKIYQNLDQKEADFFLKPKVKLTNDILVAINKHAKESQICLLIDRYEKVPGFLDDWLVTEFYPSLEVLAFIVIGSREALPGGWGSWKLFTKSVELDLFPEDEVHNLVKQMGIKDEEIIKQIGEFSKGIPLAVTLATQLVADRGLKDFSTLPDKYAVVEELVKVLIEEASPELEKIIEVCSVLRWFNDEIVKSILGKKTFSLKDYKKVQNYSFVHQGRYGLELHDEVRDFINEDLLRRRPKHFQLINKEVAEYYEEWLTEAGIEDRQRLSLEKIYHLLRSDSSTGLQDLRKQFNEAALLIQPEYCDELVRISEETNIKGDTFNTWIQYFKGSIARQRSDFIGAEEILTPLSKSSYVHRDAELNAELYYYLSLIQWYLCKFDISLPLADIAYKLNFDLGKRLFANRSLGVIGLNYDRLGNSTKGLEIVNDMVRESEDSNDLISQAYGYNSTGYFSYHLGKWKDSEDALKKSLSIFREIGSRFGETYPIGHLALILTLVGDFEKGEDLLNENMQLCNATGNREMESKTYQNWSTWMRLQGRGKEAIEYVVRAYEISSQLQHVYYTADILRLWGMAAESDGDFDTAKEKLLECLELSNSLGASYLVARVRVSLIKLDHENPIGKTEYQELKEFVIAHQYYDQVAELEYERIKRSINNSGIEEITNSVFRSLYLAEKFNVHLMWDMVHRIIQLSSELSEDGESRKAQNILNAIISNWDEPQIGNAISLKDLEKNSPRVSGSKQDMKTILEIAMNNIG